MGWGPGLRVADWPCCFCVIFCISLLRSDEFAGCRLRMLWGPSDSHTLGSQIVATQVSGKARSRDCCVFSSILAAMIVQRSGHFWHSVYTFRMWGTWIEHRVLNYRHILDQVLSAVTVASLRIGYSHNRSFFRPHRLLVQRIAVCHCLILSAIPYTSVRERNYLPHWEMRIG